MNTNKFLIQILSTEKISPERKIVFLSELSLVCLNFSFLEVKNQIFYYVQVDFDIEVLQGLMSSLIDPEEIYFITEIKGSVGTNIDEQVFMHFMSNQEFPVSSMTENNNIDMNINLSFDNPDMGFMDEDDDNIECLKKTPSIDNILDKILEKGIDSLNLQDKKILQNFK